MTKVTSRHLARAAAAALLVTGFSSLPAQEAAPKKNWEQSITAGMTLSRGNSRNFLGTLGYQGARKWTKDELLLDAAAGYGETTTTAVKRKTDDYLRGSAQLNHVMTGNFYGGLKLDLSHDDLADLDYRFTVSPLLGYYIIKNDRTVLSVEAGPSYVKERQGGRSRDYFGARFGERFVHKLNDRAKIWQSLEVIPQVDYLDNTLIIGEVGVDAALTKTLSLRVVLQDTYDNVPAAGLLKNDMKLIAGIAYKF